MRMGEVGGALCARFPLGVIGWAHALLLLIPQQSGASGAHLSLSPLVLSPPLSTPSLPRSLEFFPSEPRHRLA